MVHVKASGESSGPLTLAIDIGGSHLKAGILNAAGEMSSAPVRVETPNPAKPEAVVAALLSLASELGRFDRVSIGFPGAVRAGFVLTAPHLGTKDWARFRLGAVIEQAVEKPVRMLNDATIQGLGVIAGRGLECVLTMGTGMGFALFEDGLIAPHLELSQHPIRKNKTYDEYIGEAALEAIGHRRWNKRIRRIIAVLEAVILFDTLYIGGGNARLIEPPLPDNVKTVPNEAGITGGVRLWDERMNRIFSEPTRDTSFAKPRAKACPAK
jgi:polyphosphate glucokinase